MATDNVEFYERMQKLQAIQQQREKQRMSLEQEFNSYLKSDKRLNKVRASKLQSYWTKICEDERRSQARNKQLLREYDRVEAHVAALSARTDRLRLLKDQYEKQVEMMYPRWQEQVEIKRRHQLLQQQKEQQQLARQLQQLQPQQRSKVQQQPAQQHILLQHQLPQHQQQQEQQQVKPQHLQQMPLSVHKQQQQMLQPPQQQYHSSQPMNLESDYNHLRRTSPLVPNIDVQVNTPPLLTSEDPRYASIRFGSRTQSGSYEIPTTGKGHPINLQGVRGADSYEVPSAFGLSQQNGSPGYPQQEMSGMLAGHGHSTGFILQAPPATDAGYTKLQTGMQGRVPDSSVRHPRSSSMYSEVRHEGVAGLAPQLGSTPQVHPQGINPEASGPQATPPVSRHGHARSDSQQASSTQQQQPTAAVQGRKVPQGDTNSRGKPAVQAVRKSVDLEGDNDSVVTSLDDEDLYLEPSTSAGGKAQLKPSEALKPAERAGSAVSAKPISTARTDPFTSEDDDDDEVDDDEEDHDDVVEDNTEKEALRDALQRQLKLRVGEGPKRRQTSIASEKVQSRTEQGQEDKAKEERHRDEKESPPVSRGARQSSGQLQKPMDEGIEEEDSENDSEIGSDMSLPLSETADTGNIEELQDRKPEAKMTHEVRTRPKVPMVTVSEQGFWQLVSAVEEEIEESDNIEKIYNLPECTPAIKAEIVKNANDSGSLDHLDPNAISMVVLEQLQQMAHAMPGGCLLSDKLLDSKRTITEVTVRSFLYSSALSFWDKLLHHLLLLIRKGVMDAEEVASMVGPLLIEPDSAMADKAVDVLTSILQDLERQEDSQLDDTYSTLPSASATPSHLATPYQDNTRDRHHQAPPEVPPLDLGATGDHETPELETDRVSHDSFFDEPAVPLTETKAYQQMMQSSQGHAAASPDGDKGHGDGMKDGDEGSSEEDEEDDEIERATRLNPETPPSSRNKKRRNVLSSFGGSGSLGISYSDGDEDIGGEAKEDGGETKRSGQMSDLISSPSPSPSHKGSGYLPSAMEQSLKSTGRSDPMQRSAAFWGEESDMEESEMSVPMGTGTMKSDDFKDDFDFYD